MIVFFSYSDHIWEAVNESFKIWKTKTFSFRFTISKRYIGGMIWINKSAKCF